MEFMKIKNKKTRQNWEDNSVGLKEKENLRTNYKNHPHTFTYISI